MRTLVRLETVRAWLVAAAYRREEEETVDGLELEMKKETSILRKMGCGDVYTI